ncbi:sensor histidine kinase [Puerhibacterium puerhi]|uniref:sensor histidine kinase n=1 Tax=Puerhibacterium puerhi TaxID=2692623 RepID=UPI00135B2A5F|nr:HAMP domain-containing sensor histidine kinase [Puerhibacterium puerhi]
MVAEAGEPRREEVTDRRSAVFLVHLPFVATAGLATVGLTVYDHAMVVGAAYVAGVVVLVVALALTLLVPWQRLGRRAELVVPLLDLLATALFVASDAPVSLLAVFPVLWLAQRQGTLGVGLAVASAFVVTWLPTALTGAAVTQTQVARVALVPVVLAAVALSVGGIQRRSDARTLLMRRQGEVLRRAAAELGSERRLLEAVLGTAGAGILVIDAEGRLVLVNRLVTEVTHGILRPGLRIDDLPPDRSVAPEGVAVEDGPLHRAVRGEELDSEVGWFDLPVGRMALRASVVQLDHADPHTGGRLAVVTFENLTEQLTALELKEDFVAAASHELRTPLTSIVGHLELAGDAPDVPPAVARHVDVAARNADRLLTLVGDLLTAAAARGGDLALTRTAVDLAAVVDEAVAAICPVAGAAGLRVGWTPPAGAAPVLGDAVALRQVVDNVLDNAVKYSDAGGTVEVLLRAGSGRSGDGDVVLLVRDEGVGIAPEDVEQVFTRFYRARAVRHGSRHGTGLGLHICRQVVEAHGGTIDLESVPGRGTTVRVHLPLAGAAAVEPTTTRDAGTDAAGTDAEGTDAEGTDAAGTGTTGVGA